MTMLEVAMKLGVSRETVKVWRKKHLFDEPVKPKTVRIKNTVHWEIDPASVEVFLSKYEAQPSNLYRAKK